MILVLMFLTVAILNIAPFTKDLTGPVTSEVLLEANAVTFIKKTYKLFAADPFQFDASSFILTEELLSLSEIERDISQHLYEIERINSQYSNIPPPALLS